VTIDQQPADLTIEETYPARFNVVASGSPPISYQWLSNGVAIPGANDSSYTLPIVSLVDSGARFSVVVSNFAAAASHVLTSSEATLTVVTPTVTLKHRYTFNQSGELATGVPGSSPIVLDVVGDRHGELRGTGTFTEDGKLQFNGGDTYVNLPNNLVLGFNSITIEAWVQDEGSGGWARIFDFGNSAGGEDFPIGSAGGGGTQYMFLSFPSGFGNLRGAYTIGGGGAAEQLIEWIGNRPPANAYHHIVWTSSDSADTGRLYVNGTKVGENVNVTLTPAGLGPTVNNWLGRAQFNDPLFLGKFDEFSIYDGAMSPTQVTARMAEGPDTTPAGVRLTIARGAGGDVIISYPRFAQNLFLILESTPQFQGPGLTLWTPVTEEGVEDGDFIRVTVSASSEARFFRLSQ
jgi:hypothetical protein